MFHEWVSRVRVLPGGLERQRDDNDRMTGSKKFIFRVILRTPRLIGLVRNSNNLSRVLGSRLKTLPRSTLPVQLPYSIPIYYHTRVIIQN